jgi:hypothetical protein
MRLTTIGRRLCRTAAAGACIAAALHFPAAAMAASSATDIPRHLAIARDLVDHVAPSANHYVLGAQFIAFPGDKPGATYAVRADCSGFLLALFKRADYSTQSKMGFLNAGPQRHRLRAEDFVDSIEREEGFRRIDAVADLRPGDLIAHAMLDSRDQEDTGTTGHVFLVDSVPARVLPGPPLIRGTHQLAVSVIDSNNELLGTDDTRRVGTTGSIQGLGRGTIRLYVDDRGALVGWARNYRDARFFSYDPRFPSDTKRRKAAVGRPVTG